MSMSSHFGHAVLYGDGIALVDRSRLPNVTATGQAANTSQSTCDLFVFCLLSNMISQQTAASLCVCIYVCMYIVGIPAWRYPELGSIGSIGHSSSPL